MKYNVCNIITLSIYSFCLSLVVYSLLLSLPDHTATWVGLLAVHQDRAIERRSRNAEITNFWFESQRAARACACSCVPPWSSLISQRTQRNGTRRDSWPTFLASDPVLRLRSVYVFIDFSAAVAVTLRGWYSAVSTLRLLTAALRSSEKLSFTLNRLIIDRLMFFTYLVNEPCHLPRSYMYM